MLDLNDDFSYEMVQKYPKKMPRKIINGILYELRCANGFIKIYTEKGINYWATQTENSCLLPDFKLHFSIKQEDFAKAWNILVFLFLEEGHDLAMKVKQGRWPDYMKGREITVYMYQHHSKYEMNKDNHLTAKDQKKNSVWIRFIKKAEKRLKKANVRSNGIFEGDHPLGLFTSIRNEAFVKVPKNWKPPTSSWSGYDLSGLAKFHLVYPPNDMGFNAANHSSPFLKIRPLSSQINWSFLCSYFFFFFIFILVLYLVRTGLNSD